MTSHIMSIIIFVAMAVVVYSTPVDKDQPPLSCQQNEEYYKCSPVHCYKTCEDLIKPPPCPSVSPDCYIPACECMRGYLKNGEGICVPEKQCRNIMGI